MAQLIMRWQNDGSERKPLALPAGVACTPFPQMVNAVEAWLGIVRYMGETPTENSPEYYEQVMTARTHYKEDTCFFLTVSGVPAATVTVICDDEKKEGYIHMVACKPEFRGKGLGHLLNEIAVDVLKKEGMQTAYLTTDDWRIPAIKTYLRADFVPDLESEPDFRARWEKIFRVIGKGADT